VLWSLFLPPSLSRQSGLHGLWTLVNLSNFFIWRNFGGYWGDSASWAPLLHTWSLAVEEQFYMLFPTSILLLAHFQNDRITRWLIVAATVSLGLYVYANPAHAQIAFYMLPTRVWELLAGAALASYKTPLRGGLAPPVAPSNLRLEAAGWLGLSMILVSAFAIDDAACLHGTAMLGPTLGTVLLLISGTGPTQVSRFLSAPFMVGTGRRSYSLYLWHWPLITLGRILAEFHGLPAVAGAIAGAIAGIAFAWTAYVCVEQPLRSRGPGRTRRLAVIAVGFATVLFAAGCVARLRPRIDLTRYFDTPGFRGQLYSVGKVSALSKTPRAIRFQDVRFPSQQGRTDDDWRSGGIVHRFGDGPPAVVVLGSSHALMYADVIDGICQRDHLPVAFLCVDSTPVFFQTTVNDSFPTAREAAEFDEARRRWLRAWHPKALFVIDRWDDQIDDANLFDKRLDAFLREVSPLANKVLAVAQVPAVGVVGDTLNLRELMAWRTGGKSIPPRIFPDAGEAKRRRALAVLESAASSRFPNMRVLRPDRYFYERDGSVRWLSGRQVYYADDDHLTGAGAEAVRGLFETAIDEAACEISTQEANSWSPPRTAPGALDP
jgi:peptidoglycan/LPS O-acetylase OafA/YrhL